MEWVAGDEEEAARAVRAMHRLVRDADGEREAGDLARADRRHEAREGVRRNPKEAREAKALL